ncbi:hypothetical protein [Nocardia sp. NPDC051750]|uniref:glycoside hydrolase family 130 protein n=1 Tax=Nocardia sp. NPDC051750 TaxID=3364325 RepID=UPI0037AA4AC0
MALLYRAHAADLVSRTGLAWSYDGIRFDREPRPVPVPEHPYESAGCEDPRITWIAGIFYLTYTGFDGTTAQLCLATSSDLRTWTEHGPLFPGFNTWRTLPYGPGRPWSKAVVIHPEPWLRPTTSAETGGLAGSVTFVEELVHFHGRRLAYYGQGDTTLAVAIHTPRRRTQGNPALLPGVRGGPGRQRRGSL